MKEDSLEFKIRYLKAICRLEKGASQVYLLGKDRPPILLAESMDWQEFNRQMMHYYLLHSIWRDRT